MKSIIKFIRHQLLTFQLAWIHQFQLAGYYAAFHKSFYKQANLDAKIIQGGICHIESTFCHYEAKEGSENNIPIFLDRPKK